MIVTTQTGSKYWIDTEAKTWERVCRTEGSGELRTESGRFDAITGIEIGQRMNIICPPIVPDATGRLISTSGVTSIEEC